MKTTPLPLELLEKLNPVLSEIVVTATRMGGLQEVMLMASLKAVLEDLIAHRRELQKLTKVIVHNGDSVALEVTRQTLADLGYTNAH